MLRIPIGSICENGWLLNEQVEAAGLPLLAALGRKEEIRFVQPIQIRVVATRTGETIAIKGDVHTGVHLRCSRCLTPFDLDVRSEFSVTAVAALAESPADSHASETELAADEMDVLLYSGDSIDLREEIAQQIIMALPFNPLCKEACKGLCNQCGANLNRSTCQCKTVETGNPFAVLKNLSLPEKKE
ncbi:hypothetical protein DSCW_10250 [Desulfosarcina widdelii]|uniref:DUF177 domain-containing protein n=1 Tax=Desulfosarcina widdelii TaxID=947919 RepID=A0A5K7YYA9_9BACT|nr:DUF177 domain-containing protein [Desulfosarcina widdelii]BBO73608.1 hypothetical protein DSCW_10250 [Desulfosarcina widdelii]